MRAMTCRKVLSLTIVLVGICFMTAVGLTQENNEYSMQRFLSQPWYANDQDAMDELVRRGWKPANRKEELLFTLARQNNLRPPKLEPCRCYLLKELMADTTYVAIRGELIDAMNKCCPADVAEYAIRMLPTLPIDPDGNLVVNQSVMQTLVNHRRAAEPVMPQLAERIAKGDAGSLWAIFLGGRYARQLLDSCLAYNGTNGYFLEKTRYAMDEFSQSLTARGILKSALMEIPDIETRQLVQLLARTRQRRMSEGEYSLTDSELRILVRNNAASIQQSVQISLAGASPVLLAVLDEIADEFVIPYVHLLITTRGAYTGAGGNLQGLAETFRTIELANRSPRIRALVQRGILSVGTEYIVRFPWDQEHYGLKENPDVVIRLPRIH